MPIDLVCDDCSTTYRLKDSAAGKSLKCKHCGAMLIVPQVETTASTSEMPNTEIQSDDQDLDLDGMVLAAKSEVPVALTDSRRKSWFDYLTLVLMVVVVGSPVLALVSTAVQSVNWPSSGDGWFLVVVWGGGVATAIASVVMAAMQRLKPLPSMQELRAEPTTPKFSTNSIACMAYDRGFVAVIVDRDTRMIHFKKCFIPHHIVLLSIPAWRSCSLDAVPGLSERYERHRGFVFRIQTTEGTGSIKTTAFNYAKLRRYVENPRRARTTSAPPMVRKVESIESGLTPKTPVSAAESMPRKEPLERQANLSPKPMQVKTEPELSLPCRMCLFGGIVGPFVGMYAFENKMIPDPGVAIFGGIILGASSGLPLFLVSPRQLGRFVSSSSRFLISPNGIKVSGGLLGMLAFVAMEFFMELGFVELLLLVGAGTALAFLFVPQQEK